MDATVLSVSTRPRFRRTRILLGRLLPSLLLLSGEMPARAEESAPLYRYASDPSLRSLGESGSEWSASVDCIAAPPPLWIGARVLFGFDADLDGVPDARDTLNVVAADCGEEESGRIVLRRRFPAKPDPFSIPSVLRTVLQAPDGSVTASHSMLTAGSGSMLAIARFCARPKNGEPEWVEIRNVSAHSPAVTLDRVRLETRLLRGSLNSDEAFVTGSDTAEVRIWQPGARLVALSSWPSLRNTGDTIRLAIASTDSLSPGLTLDSLVYGGGSHAREDCASLESEGSGAAAAGYELVMDSKRWRRNAGDFTVRVRAPTGGAYDLRLYDSDGILACDLARRASEASEYSLASAGCDRLRGRVGAFILLLTPRSPRAAAGARTVIRITE